MVVTDFPPARDTGATHERTASPLICTVHAPHCAMPHPYFVPVSPSCSRMTHSSGVEGSTSRLTRLPFTEKPIIANSPILFLLQAVGLNGSTANFTLLNGPNPRPVRIFPAALISIAESAPVFL